MKILYLLDCTGDAGGGAERLAVSVLTHLDPQVYDRYLCLSRSSEGLLVEQAKAAGVKVFQLKRRSRYDLLPWLRLVRLMRREKIEILHTHKHGSNFWGAIISLLTGVPVFLAHEHSWQYSGNRGRMLIDRYLIARRATRMIAVSAPDRESMISIEHIDPSKIVVIPNGITFNTPTDVSAVRDELRLPPGALTIACVGVRAEKRVDLVIRALELLRRDQPDLQLLVIGDYQSELETLRELAGSLQLSDRVHFLGERHDVPSLLAVSDLAVLASDREGRPARDPRVHGGGLRDRRDSGRRHPEYDRGRSRRPARRARRSRRARRRPSVGSPPTRPGAPSSAALLASASCTTSRSTPSSARRSSSTARASAVRVSAAFSRRSRFPRRPRRSLGSALGRGCPGYAPSTSMSLLSRPLALPRLPGRPFDRSTVLSALLMLFGFATVYVAVHRPLLVVEGVFGAVFLLIATRWPVAALGIFFALTFLSDLLVQIAGGFNGGVLAAKGAGGVLVVVWIYRMIAGQGRVEITFPVRLFGARRCRAGGVVAVLRPVGRRPAQRSRRVQRGSRRGRS